MPNPWKQSHSSSDSQTSGHSSTPHLRLPSESQLPDLKMLQAMLDNAMRKRGTIVELPITIEEQSTDFLIMVQWDKNQTNPVWTMYKTDSIESKNVFNEEFPAEQSEILHDLIIMAIKGKTNASTQIPDELKIKDPVSEEASEVKPAKEEKEEEVDKELSQMQTGPMPAFNPNINNLGTQGYPPQGYPQPQPVYPPQGYPQPQPIYPPQGYPQPQPIYPQQGYTQQGYPAPQAYPPPNYNDPYNNQPGNTYNQIPAMNMNQSYTQIPAMNASQSYTENKIVDYSLVSKPNTILLGELLVASGLINENSLNASLKIQELVKDGKILLTKAGAILKKYHDRGKVIDQFLDQNDWSLNEEDKVLESVNSSKSIANKPTVNKSGFSPELQACFDLLVKAGILSETDLESAINVRKKHGGSVVQILQAAQKMDQNTFDCAKTCLPLIKEGLMKVEQCIIVINYSSRSRVTFDEALAEMNWVNPRKVRKDLSL